MNNWYKQKAFFLMMISFFISESVEIKASKNSNMIDSNYNQFTNWGGLYEENYVERQMQLISLSNKTISLSEQYPDSKSVPFRIEKSNLVDGANQPGAAAPSQDIGETLKIDNWLARQQNSCQNINSAYQQVYSFQTDNYYINICQLGDSFHYHRQSKFDDDTLLIPAQAIAHGGVFQATNRGTTYFVGKDGDRYYSSVMQNDNEIVFEPELPSSVDTVLARDIAEINSQLPVEGVKTDRATNASLELDRPESNSYSSQQTNFCIEANASNSSSHSWQELLGESLYTASQYAFNNGYSFVYDAQTPEQALITTPAAIVNLNIALNSDTIEQVCIRPLAEN